MRKPMQIRNEYAKLWEKVWWNRHHAAGAPDAGKAEAAKIELRWGKKALLPGDDVEWGITQGRMQALAWVMGSEWYEAGDT